MKVAGICFAAALAALVAVSPTARKTKTASKISTVILDVLLAALLLMAPYFHISFAPSMERLTEA